MTRIGKKRGLVPLKFLHQFYFSIKKKYLTFLEIIQILGIEKERFQALFQNRQFFTPSVYCYKRAFFIKLKILNI